MTVWIAKGRAPARTQSFLAATAGLMVFFSAAAVAHVSIDNAQTPVGTFKARFNVPHGCDGAATTDVRITIPEGVIGAKPMPKPGWSLATTRATYAKTYDYFHGMKVSEGVKTVTWSGGNLPNEFIDEFVISLFITKGFKPGDTLYFPVEQVCTKGSLAWTEIPAAGQSSHDLKSPAPTLSIVARSGDVTSASPAPLTFKTGDLVVSEPWIRETPGGATVAAGYVTITNAGTTMDRLVGGTVPGASRVEVHDMTMDGAVMKMRRLPEGVELPPGATVTLKPGGQHLMMMDLQQPMRVNQPVMGTLRFEKAPELSMPFAVRSLGGEDHSKHH